MLREQADLRLGLLYLREDDAGQRAVILGNRLLVLARVLSALALPFVVFEPQVPLIQRREHVARFHDVPRAMRRSCHVAIDRCDEHAAHRALEGCLRAYPVVAGCQRGCCRVVR